MKAAEGKRVFSRVPYGYMKADDDPAQWIVDKYAADIVKHIYDLCLQGYGTGEIAKQLQNEKILTPTCYFDSKGWKISREPQENPCRWCNTTVANILNDMEFTGCAINFKSSTVSYKVHDRIRKPQEEWQIIPNTQEPIIDDETFQRVQEIRSHRKRRTSTGKTSILTPKMFCGDCGAKLYYHAGRNVKDGSEYFRCSQYKTNRFKGVLAPDGEEQDAYILGVNQAIDEFIGKIIAIIHRINDIEDKWVVCPVDCTFTKEEILEQVFFQEKYFQTEIII